MPEILLTRGLEAVVDECDFAALSRHRWVATEKRGRFYAQRSVGGRANRKTLSMARWILMARPGDIVDHANGNTLDNRRSNLRFATSSENAHNQDRKSVARSGLKGVHFVQRLNRWRIPCNLKKPWVACIQFQHRRVHLGYFPSAQEAGAAYDAATRKLFGAFARPNTRRRP